MKKRAPSGSANRKSLTTLNGGNSGRRSQPINTTQPLITVLRRVPSPDPAAKGRKLDVLQLTNRNKTRTWLLANNVNPDLRAQDLAPQQELALA